MTSQEQLIQELYKTAVKVNCWHNIYGNPTYKVYTADKEYLFVDNYYIVRSYFRNCNVEEVKRKKDL